MQASMTVHGTVLKLSANDTYAWAHKAGAAWPCSTLSGHRLAAELYVTERGAAWIGTNWTGGASHRGYVFVALTSWALTIVAQEV